MPNHFGWYPRRRGILEHLDTGSISLLDLAVHDFLCLTADYRTGVAWSSSEKIHALCPAEINSRAIRRSLSKMENLGWLKRFCVRGRRGNYAIVIARYFVRDASGNWLSVNAERTTDWRNVQFDAVHDESFLASEPVRDPVGEVSGIKEVRTEEAKNKKGTALSAKALRVKPAKRHFENRKKVDPRFEQVKKFFFEEYERRFSIPPDFDGGDGTTLNRFLRRRSEPAETLIVWLTNAFDSSDVPTTWERFRLREWCGRAAKFANGPLIRNGSRTRRGANLMHSEPGKFDAVII
jgi:hypothetical protein